MGLKVPNGFYSLDKTVQRRLHIDPYGNQLSLFDPFIPKHLRNTIGKEGNFSAAEIHYGATDIRCAYQLYEVQQDLLTEQELHKVAKLENAFVLVAGDMEYNGMPLDIDRWLDLSEWAKDKAAEYENLLKRDYSEIDNWNSATQVKQLFKSLGINTVITDKVKSKKTGQNVTKDSVQELVIKEQASKFPIIDTYLKYKGFKKLHSTYGIKFLKHVSPITDRIHTNFLQILNTGRTASSNPNVQNIVSAKEDFPEGSW
jgi:DNA polymerase-1